MRELEKKEDKHSDLLQCTVKKQDELISKIDGIWEECCILQVELKNPDEVIYKNKLKAFRDNAYLNKMYDDLIEKHEKMKRGLSELDDKLVDIFKKQIKNIFMAV